MQVVPISLTSNCPLFYKLYPSTIINLHVFLLDFVNLIDDALYNMNFAPAPNHQNAYHCYAEYGDGYYRKYMVLFLLLQKRES